MLQPEKNFVGENEKTTEGEVAPTCVGSRHHRHLPLQPHAADVWIPPPSPLQVHDGSQQSREKDPDGMVKYLYSEHFPLCGSASAELQMGWGWGDLRMEDPERHLRRSLAAASLPRKCAADPYDGKSWKTSRESQWRLVWGHRMWDQDFSAY